MLFARPTENGAGIELFGDYWDFKNLYSTIHELVDDSIIYSQVGDFILALAYNIRHAYQRNRMIETFGLDEFDKVEYVGIKSLWPYLLPKLALLRHAAGRKDTSKEIQANLYRLEFITESALEEIDGTKSKEIIEFYPALSIINTDEYLTQFIECQAEKFATNFNSKKKRLDNLKPILQTLSPISDSYKEFSEHMDEVANEKNCSPHELQDLFYEWDEFQW